MITAVLDTNVIVSALRSSQGASFQVLRKLGLGEFRAPVSNALIYEYESVIKRIPEYSNDQLDDFIRQLARVLTEVQISFRWRPFSQDPGDDLVIECALAGGAEYIVTHNRADFLEADQLGLYARPPGQFLRILSGET